MWRIRKFNRHSAARGAVVCVLAVTWISVTPDARAQNFSGIPRPDHVVIVVEENRGYEKIIGASATPYINSLAQRGAVFTESFGIGHPSQPNYLALFSGSTQGVGDDSCPHHFNAPNLGTSLLDTGFTFAGYSEGLPAAGSGVCESGGYARKHAPWINFINLPAQTHLPFSLFPSDFNQLPTVAFVIPNLGNDMHDGSTERGDAWLQEHLDAYVQWAQTNNSLLIVTWDEAGGANQIATLFVGPMVQPGIYRGRVNHYHLLRTLEDMFGLPYAGRSADVPPMANVWRTGDPPPEVVLTSPMDGAVFVAPTNIMLTAEAFSSGGAVAKVEFFSGVTKLGEALGDSPVFIWSNVPPGNWSVTAKVTDDQGGMRPSLPASIKVTGAAVNPFLAMRGVYSGLFIGSNQPAFTNSGYLTLNNNAQGTFVARLIIGRTKYSLRGRFDANGSAHGHATRTGQASLTVELNLDLFGATDRIHGTVNDGTWTAILDADRAGALSSTVVQPGAYNLILPGSNDAESLPNGDGFGAAMVSATRRVKWAGELGDGTRMNQTATVSKTGAWPLYVPLYSGEGAIFGWMTFDSTAASRVQGDLFWFKPPTPQDQFFSAGFSVEGSLSGAMYHPSGAGERVLNWTNGIVVLAGGDLNSPLTNHVTLDANNTFAMATDDTQLKITIALPTGFVNGTFVHPVTHQAVRLQGAVQRGPGVGVGFFLGPTRTGSLFIGPGT